MKRMYDLLILASALFGAAVMYLALAFFLWFIEKQAGLCKKDENDSGYDN
jgi:hypothetical protein